MLPNTHSILIGIANYHYLRPLPTIVLNDAQVIANTLLDPTLCAYPPENVQCLLDHQVTRSAIRQAFVKLAAKPHKDSTLFLHVSALGSRIKDCIEHRT